MTEVSGRRGVIRGVLLCIVATATFLATLQGWPLLRVATKRGEHCTSNLNCPFTYQKHMNFIHMHNHIYMTKN